MQERTLESSKSTVQAPHTPCSHPRCVPRRPRSSRRKSARVLRTSTSRSYSTLLTVTRMVFLRSILILSSSLQGLSERPTGQDANQVSPITTRSVHVRAGLAGLGSEPSDLGEKVLGRLLADQQ